MARSAMRDDLYAVMIDLTEAVLRQPGGGTPEERVDAWLASVPSSGQRIVDEILTATRSGADGLAPLSVALRRLRTLITA